MDQPAKLAIVMKVIGRTGSRGQVTQVRTCDGMSSSLRLNQQPTVKRTRGAHGPGCCTQLLPDWVGSAHTGSCVPTAVCKGDSHGWREQGLNNRAVSASSQQQPQDAQGLGLRPLLQQRLSCRVRTQPTMDVSKQHRMRKHTASQPVSNPAAGQTPAAGYTGQE